MKFNQFLNAVYYYTLGFCLHINLYDYLMTAWKTGQLLELKDTKWMFSFEFLVEEFGSASYNLAKFDKPYQRLHVSNLGTITFQNGSGKRNMLVFEQHEDVLNIRTCLKASDGLSFLYICVDAFGSLRTCTKSVESVGMCTDFYSKIIYSDTTLCLADCLSSSSRKRSSFRLPYWQLQRFVNEGYVHLNRVVGPVEVTNCLRKLNHLLGLPGAVHAGGAQPGLGKLGGGVGACKEVEALLAAGVVSAAEALLGEGMVDLSVDRCIGPQVALRFPETDEHAGKLERVEWHTDGYRRGRAHDFSLLAGVFLSDVTEPMSGNLLVWPGSHHLIHRVTTWPAGAIDVEKLAALQRREFPHLSPACVPSAQPAAGLSSETVGDSVVSGPRAADHRGPLPSLGPPHQLLVQAGDLCLLHPDLAHAGGPNLSSNIRSAIYFRMRSVVWQAEDESHKTDLWADFPELRNNSCR